MNLNLRRAEHLKVTEREERFRPFELRETSEGGLNLVGYAAVFNVAYEVEDWLGVYTEIVMPGAFTKTLAEGDDVRLLVNHDGLPLARTRSHTLTLEQDDIGLRVEGRLDEEDPDVQALVPKLRRGDVDQMSHAFRAMRQEWNEDYTERKLLEEKLFDVSVVTFPASPTTSVGLRALKTLALAARGDREHLLAQVRDVGGAITRDSLDAVAELIDEIRGDPAESEQEVADPVIDEAPEAADADERDTASTMSLERARREAELLKLRANR
jgi:hypothetical protein